MNKTVKKKAQKRKPVTVAVSLRLERDFLDEFEDFARRNHIKRTPALKIAMKRLMDTGI